MWVHLLKFIHVPGKKESFKLEKQPGWRRWKSSLFLDHKWGATLSKQKLTSEIFAKRIRGIIEIALRELHSYTLYGAEYVALSFKVCPSVRHAWHPSRSPLCAIYKSINALYWPSLINSQLLPPHSVLYWPSTQLHHLVTHSWANWI